MQPPACADARAGGQSPLHLLLDHKCCTHARVSNECMRIGSNNTPALKYVHMQVGIATNVLSLDNTKYHALALYKTACHTGLQIHPPFGRHPVR